MILFCNETPQRHPVDIQDADGYRFPGCKVSERSSSESICLQYPQPPKLDPFPFRSPAQRVVFSTRIPTNPVSSGFDSEATSSEDTHHC